MRKLGVCQELYSARDWYDHLDSKLAPYFKERRRGLKQRKAIAMVLQNAAWDKRAARRCQASIGHI